MMWQILELAETRASWEDLSYEQAGKIIKETTSINDIGAGLAYRLTLSQLSKGQAVWSALRGLSGSEEVSASAGTTFLDGTQCLSPRVSAVLDSGKYTSGGSSPCLPLLPLQCFWVTSSHMSLIIQWFGPHWALTQLAITQSISSDPAIEEVRVPMNISE